MKHIMAPHHTVLRDMAMKLGGGRARYGAHVNSRPEVIGPRGRIFTLHVTTYPERSSGPVVYSMQASIPRATVPRTDLSHEITVISESKENRPPQVLPQEVADHVRELAAHWGGHEVDRKAILQHDGTVWKFVKPKEKT